ncbi:Crp/Fnr family transcriptional regulator [Pseudohalocynthiibacter aestuariivivens]|uniref:Crp/Fnr family transcriptional regulator n=1 Tax=Roseovarius pelagicus TaxID=2980108 RepID=A0ABY6DD89_9RHOB|nr:MULTISPECIES: Crp/Fnr family transcriptional regulator [Rhodobacterales]QIE47333.1 Crp/Fnr family transcriptional regulator [Pseudohalocynthiibacter aestuariivivens]UXX84106.1 Crp/Fnr family transcriptional regulator [Roseovarius pelagicus]
MPTECQNCPLRKLSLFVDMSDQEVDFMQRFKSGELEVEAGTTLMMEGSNSPQLFTVLQGMGLRYKTFENGERQVINFVLPGDFIGLQAGVMREMQHSVEATTPMTLCVFDRKAVWALFRDQPERAFDLTWLAAVEEHLLGESLAIVGHMNGMGRVARAFVRLHDRADALGLLTNGEMHLPYKQQDLADALGLSLVHTNKTLKKLREQGVATWRNSRLKILSYPKLCSLAELSESREPMQRPLI